MYLRSITLRGFKSFPDRTRLEFGPGVSVIVGPNGSGKSNVTDAVLWALGEQSPVAVRGQSMQDVIFGGAPGRQAARSAEVELVLDDSEQSLGLGRPEVSIVRRLDRSGEGEYRLSGARCRLVDLIEVLSDTGLGKEMHSVISQGRVEAIVTSKPRERRLLIEEAAGLGKHRKRRRRAQLKLERTQENLDRALDIEREARTRLRPLKRQAEAAQLHERLERQLLEARLELVADDCRTRGEELAAAHAQATQARAARSELEDALQSTVDRRAAAERALADLLAQAERRRSEARDGRSWSSTWSEVRKVIEAGVRRALGLADEQERAAAARDIAQQAEGIARSAIDVALEGVGAAEAAREQADAKLRECERRLDDAREEHRRVQWLIEQREHALAEGPLAVRKAELEGELTVERARAEHLQIVQGERVAREQRLREQLERDRALLERAQRLRSACAERLVRRREQLGPVNPLAAEEYREAVDHVEDLEARRSDLETALRELRTLIAEIDRQIERTFNETFQAAADNFEELVGDLFP